MGTSLPAVHRRGSMAIKPWKIRKSRYLVNDEWLTLRADSCETAEGLIIEPFYILEKADWVHVVAFDKEERILIVRQYRHGSSTICAEIPCGVVDKSDRSPLDTAKRELLEETGCMGKRYVEIEKVWANPARQTNSIHCYIAYDVKQIGKQNLDETEDIEFEFVDLKSLFQLIDSGEFSQSLHISSVYQALRKRGMLSSAALTG